MSDAVEWSMHCCTVLAALPEDQALPAARLAEFHDVPPAYLAKALQAMTRGRHHGVAAGTTGRVPAGPAAGRDHACSRSCWRSTVTTPRSSAARSVSAARPPPSTRAPTDGPCGIARAMWRAEDAWRAELAATTIGDIVIELFATVAPAQIMRGAEWIQSVDIRRRQRP